MLSESSDFSFEAVERSNDRRLSTLLPCYPYFKKIIQTLMIERDRTLYF